MALIEVEMTQGKFNDLLRFLASAAPIPLGVVNGLGPSRLIAAFNWTFFEVGISPPGFAAPAGSLVARAQVGLRHVSTADLDANANAAGITTTGNAWVRIFATPSAIWLEMIALDVPGAATQWFGPAVPITRRAVPLGPGLVAPSGAALWMRDDIVTLRFATRPGDSLNATPLNLLDGTGDDWGIRLSDGFFVEQLLQALQGVVAKPPAGTSVEDSPSASWGFQDGNWCAIGSVGFLKEDACPGLFGDVDLSITVDVVLTPAGNIAPPSPQSPQLNMTLHLSSDVSDWDSFRCWLGSGGIGSVVLGVVAGPLLGLAGGIISLGAISETIRLDAGHELTGTDVDDFTQVSSSSTTATYTSQNDLPSLLTTASNGSSNGSLSAANTGEHGMFISGRIIYFAANHTVVFNPAGPAITGVLKNVFNCGRRSWSVRPELQDIQITDRANVLGNDLGGLQVTVFSSTRTNPANLWTVDPTTPEITQLVTISGTNAAGAGSSGRIYLHTSAGIRRYDIPVLTAIAPPSDGENFLAIARCLRNTKVFTHLEQVQWLVDPPFDGRIQAVRQWLLTFNQLPAGTRIAVHEVRRNERQQLNFVYTSERGGDAAIELITDHDTELLVEHNRDRVSDGRVQQRWIIPTQRIELGEVGHSLRRSGSVLLVEYRGGVFRHDLATGLSRRQAAHEVSRPRGIPFSITLPNGQVAALAGSSLIIGRPWVSHPIESQV